ncbi:MAG: NAD-dependent epimerase/dehydratase family protein [Merismopedia sp. SIO2A8]|nr:NAD-dependent epimerase/dehydratase family protein [Merismopedia sp. SIO2A8]
MNVLVTGASGFTGSHLVKTLLDRGDRVLALVRKTSDLSRLETHHPNLKMVYGDVTEQDVLTSAMAGLDTVFHLAAYVELGIVDEAKMERVNVEGTRAVLAAAKATGVSKVLYCSTIGVFGDTQGQLINETFKRTQQGFSSGYDRTKYQAQELVDQYAAEGHFAVSVMPSGIFGSDDPHFGPVIQNFCKGRLKVWAGGDRITGIVHVDDLVDGMLLAIENGRSGDHYILSTGELTTRDMFAFLSQQTGVSEPTEIPEPVVRFLGNVLDPIGRTLNWQPPISRERVHYIYDRCVRVDGSKAKETLGWMPRSVEQTLQDCIVNVNRQQ